MIACSACSERAPEGSLRDHGAPLTLDLSRWYAGRGLVILAAILACAIWAFWTSLGGRRALGFVRLADA